MNMQLILQYLMIHPQIAIVFFFFGPILAFVCIVSGLAAFGASFGIRKMYVKALLKIFEVIFLNMTNVFLNLN